MRKFYTLLAAAFLICCATNLTFAQAKRVLYITEQKTMDASITAEDYNPITQDPIIRMLQADPNLVVTVRALTTAEVADPATPIDMANHDVIVIQESMNGNGTILKPGSTLALSNLTKPTLYNKNFAFSNNRNVGGNGGSADVSTAGNTVLSLNVPVASRTNPIFRNIVFNQDGMLEIFTAGATDVGADPGTGIAKGFSYNNSVVMAPANRPLATFTHPSQAIAETGTPVFFNDVPAGTTLTGSTAATGQTLQQRVIFFGMNYGAISRARGANITPAGLAMWRNAVYSLAGLVTSTKPEVSNAFFSLNQNYPNPSNGATTISFELKKAGQIALEVYDITGRKVATLADGNKAAGSHEVKLDNSLRSGVYFYKLSANGVSASRKMVITR